MTQNSKSLTATRYWLFLSVTCLPSLVVRHTLVVGQITVFAGHNKLHCVFQRRLRNVVIVWLRSNSFDLTQLMLLHLLRSFSCFFCFYLFSYPGKEKEEFSLPKVSPIQSQAFVKYFPMGNWTLAWNDLFPPLASFYQCSLSLHHNSHILQEKKEGQRQGGEKAEKSSRNQGRNWLIERRRRESLSGKTPHMPRITPCGM